MSDEKPAKPPITDSPWFWMYLFATAGLIALVLMGPKYNSRQAEIEREFSARQSYGHVNAGDDGPIEPPKAGRQNLTLWPFYGIFGTLFLTAWFMLWFRRFRGKAK